MKRKKSTAPVKKKLPTNKNAKSATLREKTTGATKSRKTLTKQTEAAIRAAYDRLWESILSADMKTFSSYLGNDFSIFGSANGEVFFSKRAALKFYTATAEELKGTQLRNRKISVQAFDAHSAIVREESDLYIPAKHDWTFYGHLRISCFLKNIGGAWKAIHQHASFPDHRTEEGQQLAVEKIQKENLELREAVKRRTVELEHRNRELEIEAALESIRARSLAMRYSHELKDVIGVTLKKLSELNAVHATVGIQLFDVQSKNASLWVGNSIQDPQNVSLPYQPTLMKQAGYLKDSWQAKKAGKDIVNKTYTKEKTDRFFRYVLSNNTLEQIPPPARKALKQITTFTVCLFTNQHSALFVDSWNGTLFTQYQVHILKRTSKVFEQTYTRFLDLQKAEAQAREAQIEAALERVRSRSMAMHKSEELPKVIQLVFEQLRQLNFNIDSAQFDLNFRESDDINLWTAVPGQPYPTQQHIPYFNNAVFNSVKHAKEAGLSLSVHNFTFEEKNEFFNYFFKHTSIPEERRKFILSLPGWARSVVYLDRIYLGIQNYSGIPYSDTEHAILGRFAKVFEQAYTRFLDLQKAEAQAREAQIEAALERVRAKTMAMHKSEQLPETAQVLFEQFAELGKIPDRISIGIIKEEGQVIEWWVTDQMGSQLTTYFNSSILQPTITQFFNAWKEGKDSIVVDLSGEALKEWIAFVRDEVKMPIDESKMKGRRVHHGAFFSQGLLLISAHEPMPNETLQLLVRFAKVFSQTYTRFLDLQKAEAQAKEAQIELGLERVRARTMAMQKSDELTEAATILFQQVQSLGMPAWSAGYCIWNEDKSAVTLWMSSEGVLQPPFIAPTTEDELLIQMRKGQEEGNNFHMVEMGGKKLEKHYRYMRTLPVVGEILDSIIEAGHPLPTFQIMHHAYFSKGFLLFITYEPVPDAHDIFKRFGKVFDQTYTRFLDLQKAEAQTREAEIELGLERVRARAMAMQKSDELKELIGTVFAELTKLDLALTRCLIMIYDTQSNASTWWMANSEAPTEPIGLYVKNHQLPPYQAYIRAWKEKQNKWQYTLEGKDKKDWDDYLFVETELSRLPDFVISGMKAPDRVCLSASFNSFGCLNLATLEPLSGDHFDILLRFAKVFDLTYTRFNDLQKAEAQAREAKIEAALERIRSTSLAMHHSEQLEQVVVSIFDRLVELGLSIDGAGIFIFDKVKRNIWFWIATKHLSTPALIDLPYDEEIKDNAIIRDLWNAIEGGGHIFNKSYTGETKNEYFRYVSKYNEAKVPESVRKIQIEAESWTAYFAAEKNSIVGFDSWSGPITTITDSDFQILLRFAKVFDQAYIRFLDLQKAEAQAREAQIETALEKVRSRTMAMQSSNELPETAAVLFNEFKKLGTADVYQVTIGIYKEVEGVIDFRSTSWADDGTQDNRSFSLTMEEPTVMKPAIAAWKAKKKSLVIDLSGEALERWLSYRNKISGITKMSADTGGRRVITAAYYSKGHLSISTPVPVPADTLRTLERFAAVFDSTYTRFLDLERAEANAREATIEAALEKVRGKAMAMQNSNDLMSTAGVVFTELKRLGINSFRGGVGLTDKESRFAKMYSATSSEEGATLALSGTLVLDGHPILSKIWESLMGQSAYFPVLKGEILESYITRVSEAFNSPLIKSHHEEWYGCFLPFSEGGFYVWSDKPFTESEVKILHRFNAIVDLTFRRYLELQRAEANALDALRSASLDRVRAEIASMRTKQDLERITPLIWKELTTLGIPFVRCGVFIMDDQEDLIHTFLSTPDGKAIAAFQVPYRATPLAGAIGYWREKKIYLIHWGLQEYAAFADAFIDKDEIDKRTHYLSSVPNEGIHLHLLPFMQGMLYVGNTTPLTESNLHLVQSVADAFSTAYARYEDFNQLELAKQQVDKTLADLKSAQAQLVQSEKMASLGELTAGIAHEIQNPLNFVNNFSEVSAELVKELVDEVEKGNTEEVKAIATDVVQNLEKINHHGKRAADIVKGMLQHSRTSSGQKELTDINALADEYLRLAYHGLRAKDKSFNATMKTDFDETIGNINIIPQDIGRVILNLITNAFYAVNEKKRSCELSAASYEPTVTVSTEKRNGKVEIKVADNGNGIPQKVLDKIFQPFFTTKPTGQGTGLGLSLSYDIVKAHGGEITVETEEGKGTQFTLQLPVS